MPFQVRTMVAVFFLVSFLATIATSLPASACRGCRPIDGQPCTIGPAPTEPRQHAQYPYPTKYTTKLKQPEGITSMHIGVIGALAGTIMMLRRRRASMWILGIAVGGFFALLGYIWSFA